MAHIGWGWLTGMEGYGMLNDTVDDYKPLTSKELVECADKFSSYKHGAHGMIFSRKQQTLWDLYELKGIVLMIMRYDGILGFPGGLVDPGEKPLEAINREMEEETGLDLSKYTFTEENHLISHVQEKKKMVLHFYVMEVTPDHFAELEAKMLSVSDYGVETFGVVRVPLHTMGDGVRGFPAFLANRFAGNADIQLIMALLSTRLFTKQEMEVALKAYKEYANTLNLNKKLTI